MDPGVYKGLGGVIRFIFWAVVIALVAVGVAIGLLF